MRYKHGLIEAAAYTEIVINKHGKSRDDYFSCPRAVGLWHYMCSRLSNEKYTNSKGHRL